MPDIRPPAIIAGFMDHCEMRLGSSRYPRLDRIYHGQALLTHMNLRANTAPRLLH